MSRVFLSRWSGDHKNEWPFLTVRWLLGGDVWSLELLFGFCLCIRRPHEQART
jgi:hypothetical protein